MTCLGLYGHVVKRRISVLADTRRCVLLTANNACVTPTALIVRQEIDMNGQNKNTHGRVDTDVASKLNITTTGMFKEVHLPEDGGR